MCLGWANCFKWMTSFCFYTILVRWLLIGLSQNFFVNEATEAGWGKSTCSSLQGVSLAELGFEPTHEGCHTQLCQTVPDLSFSHCRICPIAPQGGVHTQRGLHSSLSCLHSVWWAVDVTSLSWNKIPGIKPSTSAEVWPVPRMVSPLLSL